MSYSELEKINLKSLRGKSENELVRIFGNPHERFRENESTESWIYKNARRSTPAQPPAIIFTVESGVVTFGMYEAKQ
jgi:hypothetical protein